MVYQDDQSESEQKERVSHCGVLEFVVESIAISALSQCHQSHDITDDR